MSVFDLPRLHFAGLGVTRLPTGPRSGLFDLTANTPVADSAPFPVHRPAQEYHDYLDRQGTRFQPDGAVTPDGPFGSVKGWNFGGNSHFWVDATVVATERSPGEIDRDDLVVGRKLDMWGHYGEYLSTTANRARVFDVDPASNWTTAIMVGQLSLGRLGRSHDVGYLLSGDVADVSAPRWQNSRYILRSGEHPLRREFVRSVVHQFVVSKSDRLEWMGSSAHSAALSMLADIVGREEFGGLVVQFALYNMATPTVPDAPDFWSLRGTIAPWRPDEMRTNPAGRLLTGRPVRRDGGETPLSTMTAAVSDRHVTLNMITAVPVVDRDDRGGPGRTHPLAARLDAGDLELRTTSGRLVACLPRAAYLGDGFDMRSGILTVPLADGMYDDPRESLHLCGTDGTVLLAEEELNVQSDEASLFLEHPHPRTGADFAAEVTVRSFVRGRPAPVTGIEVRQFFNPRALPLDPVAADESAAATDIQIVELAVADRTGPADQVLGYAPAQVLSTDETGRGSLMIKGARGGAAKVLFIPPGTPLPCDPGARGSARDGYDNDDKLEYWPGAGFVSVRVLPDHWYLDAIPDEEVTFDLVYREVFAYYELMYSFMKGEILSLADRARVMTQTRLIWVYSNPAVKHKTFYMPSTRDMTAPQASLLLRFMRNVERTRQSPPVLLDEKPKAFPIRTREGLCRALRQAATIELAVMLQYLYALWSIPTYSAGTAYVERGDWTPEQFRLMCGEDPHSLAGIRGRLLSVAREEMTHFLTINNIVMATGQPFCLPRIDFGTVNGVLPVPLDFCLEPFGLGSLQRFIAAEQPYGLVRDIAGNLAPASAHRNGTPYQYGSLSELYAAIREAVQVIPDAFMVEKNRGGGEHHLFMRKSLDLTHPDYQLEVDDAASAVFAIDFVTEHGEGNKIDPDGLALPAEESHYDTFLRFSELLSEQYVTGPGGRRLPWNPAYPMMRNPTLEQGNPGCDLVTNAEARAAISVFNRCYAITMQLIAQHFGISPDKSLRRSKLMNASLELMTGGLRPLGEYIATLPSGRPGRTAGPSFAVDREPPVISRPDVAAKWAAHALAELAVEAEKLSGLSGIVPQLLQYFAEMFRTIDPEEL